MTNPLDGARLKVARAEEHLNGFKVELRAYMDLPPYEIPVQIENKAITVGSVIIKTEPPIHLCALLGDCVANARSSLEYFAWQLATRHSRHAMKEHEERKIYFPIIQKGRSGLDESRAWKQLVDCFVPADALDIIESVQPYNAGNDPMKWLHLLANEDKHRLPLFTIARIDESYRRQVRKIVNNTYTSLACGIGPGEIRLSDNTFQAPGPGIVIDPAGKLDVDCEPTVFLTLKNTSMPREPVERTLDQIVKFVADIIPRFERFLS